MNLSRLQNYWRHEMESLQMGLWAPVFMGVGVAGYFASPGVPPLAVIIGVLAVAIAAVGVCWVRRHWRIPCLAMFFLALGFLAAHNATLWHGTPMLKYDVGVKPVTGIVLDIEPNDGGHRILLGQVVIDRVPVQPHMVRLSYKLKDALPAIGSRVECKAALKPIGGPVLPGGYDFRRHYYFERIGATGFIVAPCAETSAAPQTDSYATATASARNALRQDIQRELVDDEAAIAEALLTGIQQGISEPTMQAMRISGLVHILSVSGLHIGLAAGIVFFTLRAFLALFPFIALRFNIKKWAAVGALLSAWAYTLFVGAPIPAVRSCLMTSLMLLAVMVDRQALSLRVVALAACFVLLLWPASLLNPSFQLSFAAVAAIIAAFEGTERWRDTVLSQRPWYLRWVYVVAAVAATSLIASLATLPFTYFHFQQMNLYGVLANMLAAPLTSFWLMPLALLSFLLAPFDLAGLPLRLLGDGVGLLIAIAQGVAALPGADWIVPAMPFAALGIIVIGGLWMLLWHKWPRWLGLIALLIALPMILLGSKPAALIDRDGKYAALRIDDNYIALSVGALRDDNFTFEAWRRHLGIKEFMPYNDAQGCDAGGCVAGGIEILRDANALADACRHDNKLVILTANASKNCPALIDRNALFINGAHSISQSGQVQNSAEFVGNWPWK